MFVNQIGLLYFQKRDAWAYFDLSKIRDPGV